jgi:cell pole-organizing protein PopZ
MRPVAGEPGSASSEERLDRDLISPDVAAASAATMAQLMARKAPQTTQARATFDGLLVETLVRQAIEPMLKDWLDEHLQEIVERLVRREVERLSRKAELS